MAVTQNTFAIIYFCLCVSLFRSFPAVADEPAQTILTSDRLRLEQLIEKASYFAEMRSDSCLIYAHEAERLSAAYQSPQHQVQALDIIGQYYLYKENFREAFIAYDEVLKIAGSAVDSLQKANYYNQLGLSYHYMSNYESAIECFFNAARLATEYKDNMLLAGCYHNIGMVYSRLKNNTEALNYYQRSLDLQRTMENKSDEADVMHNMGLIYAELNDYQEALGYYLSSLKIYSNEGDTSAMAQVYLSVGKLYENLSDWNRSRDYYMMALDIFRKTMNMSGIASGCYGLGSVSKNTGNYSNALEYYSQSLDHYKVISALKEEADCHRELADVYALLEDNKSAFEEMKAYQIIFDSVFSDQVSEDIAETETRYKTYLKDREIEALRTEREEVIRDINRRNVGLIVIVSLTLITIAVTVYYTRTLRNANEELQLEIEERMRAEKELINIKENLEVRVSERTYELERAKQKAEESDRLKSAFLANMSHEIRTPLNAITGYAGLLLRDDLPKEKRRQYNDLITKNNRLLLNIVEDLIDTSKLESGTLQLFPKKVNIANMIEQLNGPLTENLISKNKPNLEIVREKTSVKTRSLTTDPVRVQQVIWHLLDNAVKYTDEGTIRYGCYENGMDLIFYVNDTGIGIPSEYREVVFEKFRQLDESSKRKYGGTGLGLYYARKIADVLGGKVWFESKQEGGSIFYFSIPFNYAAT
ncbi:MAG: tetratricopeptide repeat protein [Bacteroidales bacterium]|nr:tetratricopeptide repeat protein [Bacteroidales bacterium]